MKPKYAILWAGLTISSLCNAQQVITTQNGMDIEVEWFSPRTVHIHKTLTGKQAHPKSLSVIASPIDLNIQPQKDTDGTITLQGEELTVIIHSALGTVTFVTPGGQTLLAEKHTAKSFEPIDDAGKTAYQVSQTFSTDSLENFYGLGQSQNGLMAQQRITRRLVQQNTEDVTPFIQSTKGYGLYWDNYSITTYRNSADETSFTSEVGECIDYYFSYGGSADGVIREVRNLTGEVPMMPRWSYGFMQSKERYKSQDEILSVVKRYRELGIPLDCIIQDWQYWGNNYLWNAMDFLNPEFPRPQEMIDSIHALNTKLMISVWSSFGPATQPYRELKKEGLLFNFETWPQSGLEEWPPRMDYPSGVQVYDSYSEKARDIYWKYLNKGLFQRGIDGWWMDSTEPDHFNQQTQDFDYQTAMGSFRSVRNAFPLMTVGGVSVHQRETTEAKRVFILTRSGFLGQQRYGSNVWSGDVTSSWEMLQRQVPAGLNFSLTGMPHWNSDLGGFFAGSFNKGGISGTQNPKFQELYVRWMQFGIFCPMMRSHGTDVPREIYYYGEAGDPVYDALVDAVKLRYSLLPYIYSTSWLVSRRQSTFMRALMMDFVNDRRVWDNNREYMFGPAFLVAPVLEAQYTLQSSADFSQPKQMEVYLPEGTKWYDFWTQELHEGGKEMLIHTQFNRIPLFVRAGSIIPLGPDVQYADEKAWDNLEVRIYPGADGTFTLYEDEGDGYQYEQGVYSEIPFTYNEARRTLSIGKRTGNYPGMLTVRRFRIVLPDGKQHMVTYKGNSVKVKL